MQTHQAALKCLTQTQDSKTKFGNWIIFLEKFKFEIVPRKIRAHELSHALACHPAADIMIDSTKEEDDIFLLERQKNQS